MRILVLGDSLPAPRPKKGQPLEKTWPGLLKQAFPIADVWQRARPRACTLEVLAEFGLFTESLDRFDALIIQTGIVDCVPRPYPWWFIKIFEVFATVAQIRALDRVAHKSFLWLYNRPWVSRTRYRKNIQHLVGESLAQNPTLNICLIAIAPPTRRMAEQFRSLAEVVATYNTILADVAVEMAGQVSYLNPFEKQDPLEITIDDGHHLSTRGHELVANAILRVLEAHRTVGPAVPAPLP